MNKLKISLHTAEQIAEFVDICSKYECDINVYDGRTVLDAKSISAVFSINKGKLMEVQAISSDESIILRFIDDMKKFKA